ncbi:hypothetical protein I3842_15G163300 [Carya illinoinensis]|uniref:TIR domain-containing protein n=1 Tax=Carya illinoinensis TaxID=32201 RepID=A0A922D2W4_CARIL|nr:hypothetical protein I3842_15G163300 [Carya illinoinensis]
MASSSFSSSDTFPWLYHVFLSFRLGEDTCDTFIAHLYHALVRKGFHTFIDEDEIKRGDEISPALLQAIEDSRISIIVLSKNYASSTCCLDELLKILECKKSKQQLILHVFYQVNPSDIQNERGSFGEALAKHAEKLNVDVKKLQLWKAALQEVAKSAGFVLENGNEDSERIEAIVQQVEQMIMIDKGDPLVSTVFCSDFYGRSESVRIQALDQDKKITSNNIYSGFQTIWDRLSENEKNIFLDIACFFIGDVFDDVIKILDSFGFSPNIGIQRLKEKCLIYECDKRLQMHDRFRDMGRDIVRQESPQNPGARSRLFFHKDVREVLEKDKGTDRVEAILVDLPKGSDIIRLSPKAIKKITRLRFFRCRNAHFLA